MQLSSALITHPGMVREKNEDNFYFFDTTIDDAQSNCCFARKKLITSKELTLFAVFDGMGGMSDGDTASMIAAQVAKKVYKDYKILEKNDFFPMLNNICEQANIEICNKMLQGAKKRMGSTAALLCVKDENFYLCNIGDSPIYLQRNKQLTRISAEHTEREMYERVNGPAKIGQKFKLTQHLGIFAEEMAIEPYFISGKISDGDTFIICSDGLTEMVDENDISQTLTDSKTAGKAVKKLMSKAIDKGGKDNITIICIKAVKWNFF